MLLLLLLIRLVWIASTGTRFFRFFSCFLPLFLLILREKHTFLRFFCIFLRKNLHISKKCCTFAPSNDKNNKTMIKKQVLQQFAKVAKLDLQQFDHVRVWTNDEYTKTYIQLFSLLVLPGGDRRECGLVTITKSTMALQKREDLDFDPMFIETPTSWINELQ